MDVYKSTGRQLTKLYGGMLGRRTKVGKSKNKPFDDEDELLSEVKLWALSRTDREDFQVDVSC